MTTDVTVLFQRMVDLAGRVAKIRESMNKPEVDPEDAGVTSRRKIIKVFEQTEGGVTTTTRVRKVRTVVDEDLKQRQLTAASRTRLPALLDELMRTGKINVDGVELTLEELKQIQQQLKELGLGELLKKLLPNGSNPAINMDTLMNSLTAQVPSEGVLGVTQESGSGQLPATNQRDESAHTPRTAETNGTKGGVLRFLMSPLLFLKRKLGETVVHQTTGAVKEHIAELSDAELGRIVREIFGGFGKEK